MPETLNATEFKATCLDLLDRVGAKEIQRLDITKRGRVVAILTPPPSGLGEASQLHGFLAGSVVIPDGFDLTAPALDEALDAERPGLAYR